MYATQEGTTRYIDRFPKYRDAAFYRTILGLEVSSLGIGTYLGNEDDATDQAYTEALIAAGEGGINLIDTAINYRNQRSERSVGAALRRLQRDEIVVCTKAGFLTPGAVPGFLKPARVVGNMHSMDADFLADQIDRSRANLGVDTIDVFYLHNPETQLGFLSPEEFDAALRRAFGRLEQLVGENKIRWYGAATWVWTPSTSSTCTIPKRSWVFSPQRNSTRRCAGPSAAWNNWWGSTRSAGTARLPGTASARARSACRVWPRSPWKSAGPSTTSASSSSPSTWGWWKRLSISRKASWKRHSVWASRWWPARRSRRPRCWNTCRRRWRNCCPA